MRQILLLVTLFLSLSSLAGASNHSGSDAVKFELIKNLASAQSESEGREAEGHLWQFWFNPVSYTHLTLPTIYSV